MQTNAELLKFHQVLTDEQKQEQKDAEQDNINEQKEDDDNKQSIDTDEKIESEKQEQEEEEEKIISQDTFEIDDIGSGDEFIMVSEEPHNGIEFNINELPPIFVANGKGTVGLNGNIIECASSDSNITTFKTNIPSPKSDKYYFEMICKTDGKIGVGLIDDKFDEKPNNHSWIVYVNDQISNDKAIKGKSDEHKQVIIGVAIDKNDKKCDFFLNGNIISPLPFDDMKLPFNKPLYPVFLLGPNQHIDIVLFENLTFYEKEFKQLGYDLLEISKDYFGYKQPHITVGINDIIDNANKKEEKKEEKQEIKQLYPIHIIEGKASFSGNESNGLICNALTDSMFSSNFQIPKTGKFYFEIKIENIDEKNEDCKDRNEFGWASCDNKTFNSFMYYNDDKQEEEKDKIWKIGDIICCGIDFEIGTIIYWLNGKIVLEKIDKQLMGNELIPIFKLLKNTKIIINFDKKGMEYLNEFCFRSINVMNEFKNIINKNANIYVMDDIYPIKVAKGRCHIYRDDNKIICTSSSDKTIICSNFYLQKQNNGAVYYEVKCITDKKIKVGWLNLNEEEYKQNKVNKELFIGYDATQSLYYSSLKKSESFGEQPWKKNDIVGVFIDLDQKITKFYLNGVDLGISETNLKISDENNIYPAFFLAKKEKIAIIFDKQEMTYLNQFECSGINIICNDFNKTMNNELYDIDKERKDAFKTVSGEVVTTTKKNRIIIKSKKESVVVSNFKLKFPPNTEDEKQDTDTETNYKFYYECRSLSNYYYGLCFGWMDCHEDHSIDKIEGKHGWSWCPMGWIRGRSYYHPVIYHDFGDNIDRIKYPIQLPDRREYKTDMKEIEDIETDSDSDVDPDEIETKQQIMKHKNRKWRFLKGDIVGIGIDLKLETMNFFFNGKDLGIAVRNFRHETKGDALRPAVSIWEHQQIEIRFDKDCMKYLPNGYQPINLMQTYYKEIDDGKTSWMNELEDEIYEERNALRLIVKQVNFHPAMEGTKNKYYNLKLEFGEEQKDDTNNKQIRKKNNIKSISFKETFIFEDVSFIKSVKASKYPRIILRQCINTRIKNGDILGVCDIKDGQFPLKINALKPITLGIIEDKKDDDDDDENKEEKKTDNDDDDNDIFKITDKEKGAVYSLFGDGTTSLNMQYEFTCSGDSEQWSTFKANIKMPNDSGEYYYELKMDGSYLFSGWCDDECKPKDNESYFILGKDSHSFGYASYGYAVYKGEYNKYGTNCKRDDIIGCYINLKDKVCNFYVNGKAQGEIFKTMSVSGSIYPCFSVYGGGAIVIFKQENMKYFNRMPKTCKAISLSDNFFLQHTAHLKGELLLDAEYQKLSPLIGKCNKKHSLKKYDYNNENTFKYECRKCYYQSKISEPKNKIFSSFAEKAKTIEKKEDYKDYYRYSCDRCSYHLCSSCYVDENISWYTMAEMIKAKDSFEKKLLWHDITSVIGKESLYEDDRFKFYYHLIKQIRVELQDKLGWILSWNAIHQVLNIKKVLDKEIKVEHPHAFTSKWFETKCIEYFLKLHTHAGDANVQLKDYVLDRNGYKMKLKTFKLNSETQTKKLCFVCQNFRKIDLMTKTKKERQFWVSEKDETTILCYAHGCTYGCGCGGAIQQTEQWINTAYDLIIQLRILKTQIDEMNNDDFIIKLLEIPISFEENALEFIQSIEKLLIYLAKKKLIENKELLIELLNKHINDLSIFFITMLPNPVTLKDFFRKYMDETMENYYWTYTSRTKQICNPCFESNLDDNNVNILLKNQSKSCWSSFGDYLRNSPQDYKILVAKSQDPSLKDVAAILKPNEIENYLKSFANDYFRYEKWNWNTEITTKNQQYIDNEIKNIVKELIKDQSNSNDSYKLSINSFINDENWCNLLVSYGHNSHNNNIKSDVKIDFEQDKKEEKEYETKTTELVELVEKKKDNNNNNNEELVHFSLYTTNTGTPKKFFYFMFPQCYDGKEYMDEINFRISTTAKSKTNIITFKFCSSDNPTTEQTDNEYKIDPITIYNNKNKENINWYNLKYNRKQNNDKSDLLLNGKIVKKNQFSAPLWVGIAIQTKSDTDIHEHFVISSINFKQDLISYWMELQHNINKQWIDLQHYKITEPPNGIITDNKPDKIKKDYVLLIDKINNKNNKDWYNQFEGHICDLFDATDENKQENDKKIEVRLIASSYPECQNAIEIRIKSIDYALPPHILYEALKIDFSVLSMLGSEFIVKNQTLYKKIKMHEKVYKYIMKCKPNDFDHEDKKKKKNHLKHFYNTLKIYEKRNETDKYFFLTHKDDDNNNKKKEEETQEEKEEKYKEEKDNDFELDDVDKNERKYYLTFEEIVLVNKEMLKLLDDNVIKHESSDGNDNNYLLTSAKETRKDLEKSSIWPWIELIPKRRETTKILSSLTDDGFAHIRCDFGVDTAVLSSEPLPFFNLGWEGRKCYYEMNIVNIGREVTANLSTGFALSNKIETITSTTMPGKHPGTFGVEGDKGQLMIGNAESISYLQVPFGTDQCIGNMITLAQYNNDQPKRSFIYYKLLKTSGAALKEYPDKPASLLPSDELHEFYSFQSLGSKNITVEINFGPNFKDTELTKMIQRNILGFPYGKEWIENWANNAERNCLINETIKKNNIEKDEKDEKELKEISEVEAGMKEILKIDLKRLTDVILRIEIAEEQLSKDTFDDNISDLDEDMISYSIYLLSVIYYLMFLTPLKEFTKKEHWLKINLLMGLNHSGTIGFEFAENKLLDKILKICKKLKRKANIKLFALIKKYGNKLKKIDKNMDENGIRLKHPSNYSAEDAPRPLLYLGKLSISSKISEKYLLSLWKMVSRDRLLNAKETSLEALKQEFLLDFISCFLSQQSKLQIIKELIQKWSSAAQIIERNTSSFDYSYELKILISGLIRNSRNPISTAIQCAIYLKNYSELFPDIEQNIVSVSIYCEESAIKYLSDIQSNRLRIVALESNNALERALDNGLETFIASPDVQFLKQIIWIHSTDTVLLKAMEAETFRDTTSEITQWIITYFNDYKNIFNSYYDLKQFLFTTQSTKNWFYSPIGKMQFESIVTTMHMLLIIYMATREQTVYTSNSMDMIEIIFHIANANFVFSELNQIIYDPRYTKEVTNFFDLAAIVGYCGIFIMRLLVVLDIKQCNNPNDNCIDTNYNALYLFIWLITIVSMCLRFCWMLFVFKTMGLLVSSMIAMVSDIVNFVFFVFIFIIGFATIFFMGTGDQDGYDTWDKSFISMTYGMLDGMDNGDFADVYNNPWRSLIINFCVLIYVILAVVTLLNFIIAVMSTTYEKVTERAEITVNIHRWDICYSKYDLPTLPAPFQSIPILLRIILRQFIEPLIYLCFKKYINHSWFIGSFGIQIYNNENNNETFLISPRCKNNFNDNHSVFDKLKIVSYEMKHGKLPPNDNNESNFWICNYCYFVNDSDNNSSLEDVFHFYEYNNEQEPDFSFRDEDLKFIQSMEIDLCDNCFRPKKYCTRNNVWDSIISFYIYHCLSFLCVKLPLAICIFIFGLIFIILIIIPISLINLICCCNINIKNKIIDWFTKTNEIEGYQVELINPYDVFVKLRKEFLNENNNNNNEDNDNDDNDNKLIDDEEIKQIALKFVTKLFENTSIIEDVDYVERISVEFENIIKIKINEPIILLQNVGWNTLNAFVKIIENNTNDIAKCIKDATRNLLLFIDDNEDEEIKQMLQFASKNVKTRYTFVNSPVLLKMQTTEQPVDES